MDPEVLKKAPLFAGLDNEAASALSDAMGTIRLNKGEVLFHEGDAEDRLYVVISGKVKLGRSGSAGRENLLAMLLAHGLFKATLFLVVGIIDHRAGTRDIRLLSGLARRVAGRRAVRP